jgi:hypothetical protein
MRVCEETARKFFRARSALMNAGDLVTIGLRLHQRHVGLASLAIR